MKFPALVERWQAYWLRRLGLANDTHQAVMKDLRARLLIAKKRADALTPHQGVRMR